MKVVEQLQRFTGVMEYSRATVEQFVLSKSLAKSKFEKNKINPTSPHTHAPIRMDIHTNFT